MLSIELVSSGGGDDGTLDSYFWSQALDSIRSSGRSLHVKSVGNKPLLLSIADDISKDGIPNLIICLDSDYDIQLDRAIDSSSVVYTYGYSWENDALQIDIGEEIFFELVGHRPSTEQVWREFLNYATSQAIKLNKYTAIEIELHRRHLDSLFDRDQPQRDLLFKDRIPILNESKIIERLVNVGFKRSPKLSLSIWPRESFVMMFGKLYARFFHHSFRALIRKCNKELDITFPTFCRLAIAKFGRRISVVEAPIERHFKAVCEKL